MSDTHSKLVPDAIPPSVYKELDSPRRHEIETDDETTAIPEDVI
jgi:hypothetical protein